MSKAGFVVLLKGPSGYSAVRSTEGFTFMIAFPCETEEEARRYIESVSHVTGQTGEVFKRIEEDEGE